MVDPVRLGGTPLPATRPAPVGEALLPAPPPGTLPSDGNQAVGRPMEGRSAQLMRSLAAPLDDLQVPPPPEVATMGALNAVNGDAAVQGHNGTATNENITERYHEVGTRMDEYLGEPGINNWPQFGQHASATVGEAIEPLETVLTGDVGGLKDMLKSGEFFSLFKNYGAPLVLAAIKERGISDLMEMVNPWNLAKTLAKGGRDLVNLIKDLPELLEHPEKAGASSLRLIQTLLAPLLPDQIVGQLFDDLGVLHEGMVSANADIHNDFAPAFDRFLDEEGQGRDGVAAVQAMVASGQLKDPSGLVVDALRSYQAARAAGDANPEAREAHIRRANMLIAMHEQYHVAQPSFENERFSELAGIVTHELSMDDPMGGMKLLPNGGNWSNFQDRMGMVEVPASEAEGRFTHNGDPNGELYRVVDEEGQAHYYQLNPDPEAREGTIPAYFDQRAEGGAAAAEQIAEMP